MAGKEGERRARGGREEGERRARKEREGAQAQSLPRHIHLPGSFHSYPYSVDDVGSGRDSTVRGIFQYHHPHPLPYSTEIGSFVVEGTVR